MTQACSNGVKRSHDQLLDSNGDSASESDSKRSLTDLTNAKIEAADAKPVRKKVSDYEYTGPSLSMKNPKSGFNLKNDVKKPRYTCEYTQKNGISCNFSTDYIKQFRLHKEKKHAIYRNHDATSSSQFEPSYYTGATAVATNNRASRSQAASTSTAYGTTSGQENMGVYGSN